MPFSFSKNNISAIFCMAMFALCICLIIGCTPGSTDNNTPTAEDSTIYKSIQELRAEDDIPAIIHECERFLSTPRSHTAHLDMKVMYYLAFYKVCDKKQKEGVQIMLRGDSIAKAQGDKVMDALFHYQNGRFLSMDKPADGIPRMNEGCKMMQACMENAEDKSEREEIAEYLTIMYREILYWSHESGDNRIYKSTLDAYASHIDLCERELLLSPSNVTDYRYDYIYNAFLYAMFTDNRKEAERLYAEYTDREIKWNWAVTCARYMAMELGYFSKVMKETEEVVKHYRATEDSLELSENYRAELSALACCYDSLGMKDKAAAAWEEVERVSNAITIHHYNQQLQELYAKYDLQGTQYDLERANNKKKNYIIIIVALFVLGALGYWGFIHTRRVNRRINNKNRILAQQLNDLLDASKKELEKQELECTKDEPVEMGRDARNIHVFIHELTSRKLFCNPDFDRDTLLTELGIPKKTFARCFEQVTADNFAHYLLVLRLEYAAELIRQHPEYTIEGIAQECGIPSRSTFYRNFTNQFGISPAEYRSQCLKS